MIKSLSPYYLNISFVSPLTGATCTAYTLQVFVWDGLKNTPPIEPSYSKTKPNLATSTGIDKVNIARLVNDYIDFIPPNNSTLIGAYAANNQRWVKTQIIYTTANALDLDVIQLPTTVLLLQGYGYGLDGENAQPPTNKILLSGEEFKVNRGGFFSLPILIDEPVSTINAVDETIDIYFQDTILSVLTNDNLGFTPTIIKSISSDIPTTVGTLTIDGSIIQFTKGAGPIVTPQTFTYTIQDSLNNESTATVALNITELPVLPLAVDDTYDVNSVDVIELFVLTNDALGTLPTTITSVVQTGLTTGVITITGSALTFTPNGVVASGQTFTYTITDDTAATSTATVTLNVASGIPTYYQYYFSSPGRSSAGLACAETEYDMFLYSDSNALDLADILYLDSGLTTPINGGDLWFQEGIDGVSYQIDVTGTIIDFELC